jgi:hypothetical protein
LSPAAFGVLVTKHFMFPAHESSRDEIFVAVNMSFEVNVIVFVATRAE